MKLHRLVLTNYRGIAHREIEFPDHGVVVVCGANEVGKSSMIEALDLLLESRDRSTKKEVKQVKPTHSDVGSEVSAEISSGPYRFVYRKRFHKKCETELTVLTPRREQLTGDEAHERVRAMLAETVDNDLWHAQRVLQATSTAAVDLSGCDALSRALDVAAGAIGRGAVRHRAVAHRTDRRRVRPLLHRRPDAPPASGPPRSPGWPTAEAAVAECAAAVAEVDDRVRRHADLTEQVAELSQRRLAAGPRLVAAQAAADKIAELTNQAREAKLVADAAAATSAAAAAAHDGRLAAAHRNRHSHRNCRRRRGRSARGRRCAVDGGAPTPRPRLPPLEEATRLLADLQRRAEAARRTVDELAAREEADRLSARLAKIDAIQRDRDRVCAELSEPPGSPSPRSYCGESKTPRPRSIASASSWR